MSKFWGNRTPTERKRINAIRKELNDLVDEAEARILAEKADEEAAIAEEEVESGRPY